MTCKNLVFCLFWENGCVLYDTSSIAAWVQAIGAILAIWGAFKISERQHEKSLKAANQQRKFELDRKYEICFTLLAKAQGFYRLILEERVPNQTSFEIPQRIMDELINALKNIPPFEYPSATTLMFIGWIPDHLQDLSKEWFAHAKDGKVSIQDIDNPHHSLGHMLRQHMIWLENGTDAITNERVKMKALIDSQVQG